MEIPREFQLLHKSVTLVTNVFFVNKIPFFITLSRDLCFVTVEHMRSRTSNQRIRYMNKTCSLYAHASYNVEILLLDMEFDPVSSKMLHGTVNMAEAREHVGDIEREIRVGKERERAMLNTLPFRAVPQKVITELVYFTALCLNTLPTKTGTSKVSSPSEIVSGNKLDFKLHFRIDFGEYENVHDEPSPTNNMK